MIIQYILKVISRILEEYCWFLLYNCDYKCTENFNCALAVPGLLKIAVILNPVYQQRLGEFPTCLIVEVYPTTIFGTHSSHPVLKESGILS